MATGSTSAYTEQNITVYTEVGSTIDDGNGSTCLVIPNSLILTSMISSAFIGSLSLYMVVALTMHFVNESTGLIRRKHRCAPVSSLGRRDKTKITIMNLQMLNASGCIAVRCVVDIVVFHTGYLRNPYYATLSRIEILLNIVALSSMYLVLWLRQWSFYNHPTMEDTNFRKFRIVCCMLLAIMVATGIWNATAFLVDRQVEFDERGCIVRDMEEQWPVNKFYVLGACTLFYQFVLLSLFVYPLAHHARNNLANDNRRRKSVFLVLQRVFSAAVLCSITDLVAAILSVVLENLYPESSFIVYNYNLAINFVCLLYTFSDWRRRVLYPCKCCKPIEQLAWGTTIHTHSHMNTSGSGRTHDEHDAHKPRISYVG